MRSNFILLSALMLASPAALAEEAAFTAPTAPPAFTDAQKAAIEDVVRTLLTIKEPDLISKAATELRHRQEQEAAVKRQATLAAEHDKLFDNASSPTAGNPNGDVTVIEFFDYQCGFCKTAQDAITKLLSADRNVKFVYKEYPILGPESVQGSKAGLASSRQGKYREFHDALMATKGHLSADIIFSTAEEIGLDVEKLKADMADEAIKKTIDANIALAGDIGARGTPTFLVGEQFFGGAINYEQMQQAVENARQKARR
jgi:protein-disulfide isomerase